MGGSSGTRFRADVASASYLYGPDGRPVEHIANGVATWYHHDQLGSTRTLTNVSGAVVATATYGAYGNPSASTGMLSPLGFAGEYTDAETGFTYLRARYYDPGTGQFISRDPLTAMTGAPYSYVDNNPLNGTDPLGLFCLLGHVNGNSGRCRGTNVATDLKVAGVVLSAAALPVAGLALAGPELALLGVNLGTISIGLGAASTITSMAVAGLDCRHGLTRDCWIDLAEVAVSGFGTAFGIAGVTKGRPVLRMLAGVVGLASSTASLMDTCRPGKTIFES